MKLRTCLIMTALVGAVGCQHEKPNYVYMPDMAYSPAMKAQEGGAMRMPVAGTVPRDFSPYAYRDDAEAAGRELVNPLPATAQVLTRGQAIFDTYCIVCHGPTGSGAGFIVPKFPRPPTLHSEKVRGWSDGRIFHVITVGQNLMPSYASQIEQIDRWAVIHYLRVLQGTQPPAPPQQEAPAHDRNPAPVVAPSGVPSGTPSPTSSPEAR